MAVESTPWPDNRLVLTGRVAGRPRTRTSPAGVRVTRFPLEHEAGQAEDGGVRQVRFRVEVHARGHELQDTIAGLDEGVAVRVLGQLAHTGYRTERHRLVIIARRIQIQPESETRGVE